jgi:hypothetical protein
VSDNALVSGRVLLHTAGSMNRRVLAAGISLAAVVVAGAAGCSGLLGISDRSLDPGTDAAAQEGGLVDVQVDMASPESGTPEGSAGEGGACGDTMTSTNNCGRCGHDCLGGTCTAGVCQPVAIVPGSKNMRPWQLALTDTAVYFTDSINGAIAKVNKDGTGLLVLDSSGFRDNAIGLDDAGVFFSDLNDNAVVHCTLTSCGAGPSILTMVPSTGDVTSLAVDQGITFTDDMCDLYRLPTKQAGTPATLVASDGGSPCPLEVKSDGTYLYVANDTGEVVRMGFDGGGVLNLSGNQSVPLANSVAVDSQAVYWVQQDPNFTLPGTINIAGLDGSNPHVLVGGQVNAEEIVSDGTNVYWTVTGGGSSGNSGTVMMCSPANCQPVTLASQQPNPSFIAVDAVAVYWTDFAGVNNFPGTVMKVAKP